MVKNYIKILISVSLFSWILFFITADINLNGSGYPTGINYLISFSLFMISIAFVLCFYYQHMIYGVLCLIILTAIIFISPIILEPFPHFTYNYRVLGFTESILLNGHINFNLDYLNWPGLMIIGSELLLLLNISGISLIILYSLFVKGLMICFIFCLAFVIFNKYDIAILSGFFYILFDWTGYYQYTPPSLGMMLFLLVVIVLYLNKPNEVIVKLQSILIMLFITIIIVHLLTSLVIITVMITLLIIIKCKLLNKLYFVARTISLSNNLILFILLISWLFFVAIDFTSGRLPQFFNQILDLMHVINSTEETAFGMSDDHTRVMYIKILYSAFIFIITFISLYISIKIKTSKKIFVLLIISITSALIGPLFMGGYGGEILARSLAYVIPFCAIIIASVSKYKYFINILIITIVVSSIIFPQVVYGNEKLDYVDPSEFSTVKFYYQYHDKPVQSFIQGIWLMTNIDEWRWNQVNITNIDQYDTANDSQQFVYVISNRDIERAEFQIGDLNYLAYEKEINHNLNRVYNNIDNRLYIK